MKNNCKFISLLGILILLTLSRSVLADDNLDSTHKFSAYSECSMVKATKTEEGYIGYTNFSEACIQQLEANGIVFGRGGASLISPTTGKVYAIDPDTRQEYTLEKLLEIGRISAEDYQVHAAARDAFKATEKLAEQIETPDSTQSLTEQAQVAEQIQTAEAVQEPKLPPAEGGSADLKVLPKTGETNSLLTLIGLMTLGLGFGYLRKSD